MKDHFRDWILYRETIGESPLMFIRALLIWTLTLFSPIPSCHADDPCSTQCASLCDLTELSLEELMNIEVISVSKKAEKLSEAAAAIHVITQEDIRRSGATSIPELLRMSPGVEVAQIRTNTWSVTSRGFSGLFANKLLVLIDGRSIYTPMFSGVYWQIQDVMLEDVERIEVIRGPGGTIWGANAVNGVINIITKDSKDTQGGLLTGGGGNEEQGFGALRYGGRLGKDATYRVYSRYMRRDSFVDEAGHATGEGKEAFLGGFRADWTPSPKDSLTLQGDIHDEQIDETYTVSFPFAPFKASDDESEEALAMNVLGRWKHSFSDDSDAVLQFYFDRVRLIRSIDVQAFSSENEELVDTFDLDLLHRFSLGERHKIIWGAESRFLRDHIDETPFFTIDPQNRNTVVIGAFLQDEISLITDRLRLILGSKIEHNDYTGFEYQPSGRLLWTPTERQTAWTAVSRAVRTPTRYERDMEGWLKGGFMDRASTLTPVFISLEGNRNFESEELLALELGYRVQPSDRLSLDIATFYNIYDKLRTVERGNPYPLSGPSGGGIVIPLKLDNEMDGKSYGAELGANWDMLGWWRFRFAYSHLVMHLELDKGSRDVTIDRMEDESPRHQIFFRSLMDLSCNLEFDVDLRYVDNLVSLGIDDYVELDVRLGWHPLRNLELCIVVRGLLDSRHPEYSDLPLEGKTEVERSVYGKVAWRF